MGDDDRTDPRTVTTDKKITAAALALLREGGPHRVTIEAVSAASGVAKTSIYRRYANSLEMLEGALEDAVATYSPQRPSAPASSSELTRMRWWSVANRSAMTSE